MLEGSRDLKTGFANLMFFSSHNLLIAPKFAPLSHPVRIPLAIFCALWNTRSFWWPDPLADWSEEVSRSSLWIRPCKSPKAPTEVRRWRLQCYIIKSTSRLRRWYKQSTWLSYRVGNWNKSFCRIFESNDFSLMWTLDCSSAEAFLCSLSQVSTALLSVLSLSFSAGCFSMSPQIRADWQDTL